MRRSHEAPLQNQIGRHTDFLMSNRETRANVSPMPPLTRFLQRVFAAGLCTTLAAQSPAKVPPGIATSHGAADFEGASQDARKLQLASGLKLEVWAADPQLANGVAFSLRAAQNLAQPGRPPVLQAFVAESFRWANSVFDITQKTNWLLADMGFRHVQDRALFLAREFSTNSVQLTKDSEQIRLVEDRDGDRRADHSEVFADGFNSPVDGTAAGVLAQGTNVWFANIPNITRLSLRPIPQETPSNQPARESTTPRGNPTREDLATGFGVHIGVSGHDLHGLIRGPDGRIYMSIGDRGISITNREGVLLHMPDCGGVLRCEPDGRKLEIFCYGLRNPQELAFDDLGNLWTVDNDTAGADPCRLLHLVEDGDYGWRTSYQHLEGFGEWVQLELWKGDQDGILPLAGTVSQGPSGLAYVPGPSFGKRFEGAFLHCDFPGGVVLFTTKSSGSTYTLDRKERFAWNCWPTDVDFGPDGAVYILDWVTGWGRPEKGRIYRISPASPDSEAIATATAETFRLLGSPMSARDGTQLLDLLRHPDGRVRLEAQWEIAQRGPELVPRLAALAHFDAERLPRLHALWALRHLARENPAPTEAWDLAQWHVLAMIQDPDRHLAAEAAVALADLGWSDMKSVLVDLLGDANPTVRRIAATAAVRSPNSAPPRALKRSPEALVASLGAPWATETWTRLQASSHSAAALDSVAMGRKILGNTPADRFLQHAAARMGFGSVGISPDAGNEWVKALGDPSPELRETALLTLRRVAYYSIYGRGVAGSKPPLGWSGPVGVQLTNTLSTGESLVAAGRAIHDVPIIEGIPALASFITKIDCPTNLHSRVIDACYRLGTQQHAQMLAGFAARRDVPEASRVLALRALADWERPSPLDRVNGLWRPLVAAQAPAKGPAPRTSSPAPGPNPLLSRAAELQAGRNLGRAAELPSLPADLGRSASFDEATHLRRNPAPAQRAFLRVAGELMDPSSPTEAGLVLPGEESKVVQLAVVQAAIALRTKEASSPLYDKFTRTNTFPEVRRAIVGALAALNSGTASEAVRIAIQDADPLLKASAVPYLDRLEGEEGFRLLSSLALDSSANVPARQAAWRDLGNRARSTPSDNHSQRLLISEILQRGLDQLSQGSLPPALHLDVLEAGSADTHSATRQRVDRWSASRATEGALASYLPALEGGNAQNGRRLFFEKPETQCSRCHRVGTAGGTVGPALDAISKRLSRRQLLESIVLPNAQIAAGFENVVLTLKDGKSIAGTLKSEINGQLTIVSGEDGELSIASTEIQSRDRGPSAMPDGLAALLSPFELRDLIEYLASLK